MFSEAARVEIKAYIWNEGGTPVELEWDGKDEFDPIQRELCDKLDDYEYGKIVAVRGNNEPVELLYRAFTCPYRGRRTVVGVDAKNLEETYQEQRKYCSRKVFSPAELYALRPEPLDILWQDEDVIRTHIDELDSDELDFEGMRETGRFEYRPLAHSPNWGWQLGTVWFDGRPVMVVNSSGDDRENKERWVTDAEAFGALVIFLRGFVKDHGVTGFVDKDMIVPSMTEFFGSTIHDYYDVAVQRPVPEPPRPKRKR
jgi:hypothetical protein